MKKKLKVLSDIESFIVILLAGLMGFIDLGDVNLNYATLAEINVIAFHLLSFLDQSTINTFELKLANFASKIATFSQIFTLPWKFVAISQTKCAIKVNPSTCDVTYANCKIYTMHVLI